MTSKPDLIRAFFSPYDVPAAAADTLHMWCCRQALAWPAAAIVGG
jgi:hypothetical protein